MTALLTRRSVLLSGVAVGTVAGGAGFVRLRSPAAGFKVLAEGEIEIIEAIARVLFPPGYFPVHGGDGGTAPVVDHLLHRYLDPLMVEPFRYLLRAIQVGTVLSRGRTFASLSRPEAREVLDIWASDEPFPRRLASDSFKVVLGMAFFRRPEVTEATGWRVGCAVGGQPGPQGQLLDLEALERGLDEDGR